MAPISFMSHWRPDSWSPSTGWGCRGGPGSRGCASPDSTARQAACARRRAPGRSPAPGRRRTAPSGDLPCHEARIARGDEATPMSWLIDTIFPPAAWIALAACVRARAAFEDDDVTARRAACGGDLAERQERRAGEHAGTKHGFAHAEGPPLPEMDGVRRVPVTRVACWRAPYCAQAGRAPPAGRTWRDRRWFVRNPSRTDARCEVQPNGEASMRVRSDSNHLFTRARPRASATLPQMAATLSAHRRSRPRGGLGPAAAGARSPTARARPSTSPPTTASAPSCAWRCSAASSSSRPGARRSGHTDAIVGGFFVRPDGAPLGEVRTHGVAPPARPVRRALGSRARVRARRRRHARASRRRDELPAAPRGDLLQAGPLLVRDRERVYAAPRTPRASGSAHTSSTPTSATGATRAPRSALAPGRLLAVAVDGRGSARRRA